LAFDVVTQIIQIEKEGEQLIKSAQLQAAEILKEAHKEADAIEQKAKEEAAEYYNKVIANYEAEANELSNPILESSKVMSKNLKEIPAERLGKASNMVIERIVNSHGDS
jgi:vacuolar-type H+-ATPase subunit H